MNFDLRANLNWLKPVSSWFFDRTQWLYPLYATFIFIVAVFVLHQAYIKGEFEALLAFGLGPSLLMILLALLIIQLGFTSTQLSHVSFDRVTQVGLIWITGFAGAALINGLASLIYPLINSQFEKKKILSASFNSLHNAGMFALSIYFSGKIYVSLGGSIPLVSLTVEDFSYALVVFLSMQFFNVTFMFFKTLIAFGRILEKPDWLALAIEFSATMIALLFALIHNNAELSVSLLFVIFLLSTFYCVKHLNSLTSSLTFRIEQIMSLRSIAKAISSSLILRDVTQKIYQECCQMFNFREFYFGVLDEKTCLIKYEIGRPLKNEKLISSEEVTHHLLAKVIKERQPLYLPSFSNCSADESILIKENQNEGSFIGVPIHFDNEILGVISLESELNHSFSQSDFNFVRALANHAGIAIKNAVLFQKSEERKDELEQKVRYRTEQIEAQKRALSDLNSHLEIANQQKDELLENLKRTAEELELQCRQDALTGLYNRRHVDGYLEHELERVKRSKGTFSLALLDIDYFKRVNDEFSHSVGDETLKVVAGLLTSHVRSMDMVARIGGEEILICLPDTNKKDAVLLCDRLRLVIQNYDWQSVAEGLELTVSLGVAEFDPAQSTDLLIKRCDVKLYQAKHYGRNRVCS